MYRYNYDYQASVEEFLNFKWTLVKLNIFNEICLQEVQLHEFYPS